MSNLYDLILNHLIDDGAIFYLNGTVVGRFNMPEGTVNPNQFASPTVSNATINTISIPYQYNNNE